MTPDNKRKVHGLAPIQRAVERFVVTLVVVAILLSVASSAADYSIGALVGLLGICWVAAALFWRPSRTPD